MDSNIIATNQTTAKRRIGYIDALRGFTMILVVCFHILPNSPYTDFFQLFRMPLFFFISGFILYKDEHIWSISNSTKFLSTKFLVQIIPTAIFLFLNMFILSINTISSNLNGYWFTVSLFMFFAIYILCKNLIRNEFISNILLLACALFLYIFSYNPWSYNHYPFLNGFIVHPFGFLIFFIIGIITKKYFDKVVRIFNNNIIMMFIIALMIIGSICFLKGYFVHLEIRLVLSILGIFSFFYFFMKNGGYMDNSRIGNVLQFIGRRTLDIYLLHFFFIRNSLSWIENFRIESPTLIFIISIIISLVIIGICLLISKFLRTNPLLGKILFGAKRPDKA